MQGKIIRGIAGFYYVHVQGEGTWECRAKGKFRNKKIKPLVGDNVEIEVLDVEKKTGNVVEVLPRKNQLLRPAVANVDQAAVIFSASYPEPNLNLLDRFLLMMSVRNVSTIICFNKSDTVKNEQVECLKEVYKNSGSKVFITSTVTNDGISAFYEQLKGRTTALAGPSGVGKSSVMNTLFPEEVMETGSISEKIKRGKHTTRHSELFLVEEGTYLMDTPGFTSLMLPELEKEALKEHYPEFLQYQQQCRFNGCVHINEPNCAVKEAVQRGEISEVRYQNYVQFFEEIKNRKKY